MKWFKLMVVAISCLIFVGSAYGYPEIKIIPANGATYVAANPGDELQFQVHLFNSDENIRVGMYAFSLWLDPTELEFVSYSYGPDPEGYTFHYFTEWTEPRNDKDTNYEPWWGSFDAQPPIPLPENVQELEAGGDWNLGTLTVQVLNPVADGDWDVKIKYYEPMGETFFVNDWNWYDWTRFQQVVGTDVIPTGAPVPIPAAVWLLGSGVVGLLGVRRRLA